MDWHLLCRLMRCFPNSFINQNGEFIAHRKSNQYFSLIDCKTYFDVTCKMLEWFSRGAYKTQPYVSDKSNHKFHKFMLKGINDFLETDFTEEHMEVIYTYIGNGINRRKTEEFITSNYNFEVFWK